MSEPLSRDGPPETQFEDVLAQTQASLINFARGLAGDWELARDITQDTFVAAWRSMVRNMPPFDTLDDTAHQALPWIPVASAHEMAIAPVGLEVTIHRTARPRAVAQLLPARQ